MVRCPLLGLSHTQRTTDNEQLTRPAMDETPKKKSLSEISHLFLSSVRDNATGGVRPKRLPPGAPRENIPHQPLKPQPDNVSVDLTPEEFAQVYGHQPSAHRDRPAIRPVSAIIGSHLNGSQFDRVKQYARHLAADGKRIGLIEADAGEFRVMCFDRGVADASDLVEPLEVYDARQMTEALEELAWDIDRWILLLPNPRVPEARALLREVDHWVLLSTCDHDGVVSCYRAIKGLVDTHRPRLTLALLNPSDETEAGRVYRKIAGVCQQFLNWNMEAESAVQPAEDITEHVVLLCRPNRDKAAVATGPQWQIVGDFLARAKADQANRQNYVEHETNPAREAHMHSELEPATGPRLVADVVIPGDIEAPAVKPSDDNGITRADSRRRPFKKPVAMAHADDSEITDLPSGETTEAAVLSAVMKKTGIGLVECPVKAPMCPQAVLAVNRDRRLIILAVARQGLAELRSIGLAYRWVIENRPLLSMALPQFSIDTHALPCLRLLVDRADLSADLLQPMLQSGNVTVQTYRKLRLGRRRPDCCSKRLKNARCRAERKRRKLATDKRRCTQIGNNLLICVHLRLYVANSLLRASASPR